MDVETQIKLNRFKPRPYQLPIFDAIENKGYRRVMVVAARRAGKDVTAFNLMIRAAIRTIGVYYYIFPTYSQAKKVIWDSITNTGEKFLDYIPPEIIKSKNSQEMKITFINDSIIQLVGSDNIDCYDDQTEILTDHGWVSFGKLYGLKHLERWQHPKVATLRDGCMVFEEPTKYIEARYSGTMYSIKNKAMDMLVTPNHRFYVKSSKGVYKFKRIDDPTIMHDSIPATCDWIGKDQKMFRFPQSNRKIKMEEFVALMGIYLSEGSCYNDKKNYRISIAQTKPHIRVKIKALLQNCNLHYIEYDDQFVVHGKDIYQYFSKFGKQPDRYIPNEIRILNKKYLSILFEWLLLGDGYKNPDGSMWYYSCSKHLINCVQEIILKLGFNGYVTTKAKAGDSSGKIRGRQIKYKHDLYAIRVRTSKFKRFASSKKSYISTQDYNGNVYCVAVPSGVIKVRRNGKECWSGNSLVGTNPRGVVFSEYALQSPLAYQFLRPILLANDGWALFISTPRGKNHMWELYNIAKESKEWWTCVLSIEDTGHISIEDIEKEKKEGIMSEPLIMQEYYCSFELGVEGSYYSKYIDKMRIKGQISIVPWESSFKVNTAWDLGVRDATSIIFFQVIGQVVRIIDCYENSKEGLEHYIGVVSSKPYMYGKHFAPHDIRVREFGTGITRWEKARQLGIKFTMADNLTIEDGIEAVRSAFSRIWIDETNCAQLIKALENYRQEYDAKKKVYKPRPLHNEFSHMCFIGETYILTDQGNKQIKDIKIGDKVKTPTGYKKVLMLHKRETNYLCDVHVGNIILHCTPEHMIFTQKGLVQSDTLSYTDVLEHYSYTRNWIWKKIYGYFSKVYGLEGFKKTILSLKMKRKQCLMATFIDGMEDIMLVERQSSIRSRIFIERFGHIIITIFQMAWISIMKIITGKIIQLKILRLLVGRSTLHTTPIYQTPGLSQTHARSNCNHVTQKQQNGIGAKKGTDGIRSMRIDHFQQCKESNTIKYAQYVKKNTQANKLGKNIVRTPVKQKIGLIKDSILSNVLVVFVKMYLHVINIWSKKHAVKSAQSYRCATPKQVYDLTIEDDHCYYANGYLVSNSDAMRYLCVSLPRTQDGVSAEDLSRSYRKAVYGEESNSSFFTDKTYY